MTGRLYVIGVGPGDPELLTLRGARIIKEVKCICVPKGKEEGSSLALSIIKGAVNISGKEIMEAYFPMRKTKSVQRSKDIELDSKWQETIEAVYSRLNKGIDMAFITIGDPAIYSTFFYLYDKLLELNPELEIEIIPGVSSINASAARAKISLALADEKIAILPANYMDNLKDTLEKFDTVVLMKVYRVFDDLVRALNDMHLLKNAVYVSRAGMGDERIVRNIQDVKREDLNYFSMVIVRK
ncbi:MAG: precorrin-2 C(20)-methyltransferase [Nitrospirae bacterium]|nr:precorrin-2 C(20)-methyltransferase [Nitrospirota bacterium]